MPLNKLDRSDRRLIQREAILDAALSVFAAEGFNGAATSAIARKANVPKSVLYYYFPNKETLYAETFNHIFEIWDSIFDVEKAGLGPREFLTYYIRRKIEVAIERPEISKLFMMENMREKPMLISNWARAKGDALESARTLQNWMDSGLIKNQDPMLLLIHIWSICEYYSINQRQILGMLDIETWDSALTETLVNSATEFILTACGTNEIRPC